MMRIQTATKDLVQYVKVSMGKSPYPVSDRIADIPDWQLRANNGNSLSYSITSSAMSNSFCGTAIPSTFAVLRLLTSELGGLLDGKIGGFSPLRVPVAADDPNGVRGSRQLGDMCAADEEKSIGAEHDRLAGLLRGAGESLVDLAIDERPYERKSEYGH